ncbi:MAG: penicillin amidase [Solirubrobacteraceae bacterium]|nr:penicillin amidase [Solirubrobacteraceae bacterium]
MKLQLAMAGAVLVGILLGVPAVALARPDAADRPTALAGLQHPVRVVRDRLGIPHVYARNDHDVFFMNGYLHAQDRFFQMDDSRPAGGRSAN